MLVRDIVERPASAPKSPGEAPTPPRAPVASKAGFPIAAHRSRGASAFARARRDDVTRRAGGLSTGQGRPVDSVPNVGSAAAAELALSPTTEEEKIRRQVDEENHRRIERMSPAERDQEANDLKESFGPGVRDMMRQRKDDRTPQQLAQIEGTHAGASMAAAAPTSVLLSEDAKILASADTENRAKVAGMSLEEHAREMEELEDLFGTSLLAKLRARAIAKADGRPLPTSRPRVEPKREETAMDFEEPAAQSQSEAQPELNIKVAASSSSVDLERKPKRSVQFSDTDAPSPAQLKQYFPDSEPENNKMQWMEDTPMKPAPDEGPRFDLTGTPLSSEAAAKLPTHLGLHHHGASPDLAGYTLSEITHLCYSTVTSQRITMIGVLAKLIKRYRSAVDQSSKESWVTFCTDEDVLGKGVDVAVGVLSTHTRSIGVFVSAVELLYVTLGGPWEWMDSVAAEPVPFHPEPTKEGEPTGVASVPWDDLSPQLQLTLSLEPGAYPESTLDQLLQILRRAALAQPQGAQAVTSLVPPLLRSHVLSAPWPLDPTRPPNTLALDVLHDVTLSSRASAEALLGQNVYAPLLKFATTASFDDPAVQGLLVRVMRLFYHLGRYGLAVSTATTASEIWLSVGRWVAKQLDGEASEGAAEVVRAYFDLVSVWTVSAVDPHRTTPEHDLTWAQVGALGWVDEELSAAAALQGSWRWAELGSVLSALVEWVAGSIVNEPKRGEAVKARVLASLRQMKLIDNLLQSVADMAQHEDSDGFNTALAQVFRLHSLLKDAGELLESPEKERLISWLTSPTRTYASDVYLRHALLEVSRADKVLSVAEWGSNAFDLVLSYAPGDEPLALSLVDDLLRTDWTDTPGPGHAAVQAIGHRDGLQILRPLVHHTVLPSLSEVLGPRRPDFHYLKATTTLRPPPANLTGPDMPGLPLSNDWVFSPLNELLASGSSDAFALAPKDWDAGETQLTRATLALALLDETARGVRKPSMIILNVMKVFMLEHGQADAPNTEHDVFRDDAVNASLTILLDSISANRTSTSLTAASTTVTYQSVDNNGANRDAPLEKVARPFLGAGVPFFQFYTDLLALYESSSFGDATFGRVLLPPLSGLYDADYRRLFWVEAPDALRSVRTKLCAVPSETGDLLDFFEPRETERDVLSGYARALVTVLRDRGEGEGESRELLPIVASHHVAGLFWTTSDEERTSLRVQLMVVMLSSATDPVLRRIVQWDLENPLFEQSVGDAEISRRVQDMARITGPRGQARLKAAGYM